MARRTTAIKPRETQELAAVPDTIDFLADAGAGLENTTSDSFAIPFLRVLQKGSPEVDEASGRCIEGARAGMLYNTVTGRVYPGKDGIVFVQATYQLRHVRWSPRGEAGGFRGEYTPDAVSRLRDERKVVDMDGSLYFPLPDGTVDPDECDRLQDTRNHFGLLLEPGEPACRVLLSLTSTQIKKSKLLMAMFAQQQARGKDNKLATLPTFAHLVRVTTVPESNDRGTWFGVHCALEGKVGTIDVYEEARAFRASIEAGQVRASYAEAEQPAQTGRHEEPSAAAHDKF